VKKLGSKSQFSSSFNISQVMLLKSKHGYPMLLDFWLKTPWNIHSTVLRRWHRSLSSGRELWGLKKGVFNVGFVQKSKPNANHGAGNTYIYIGNIWGSVNVHIIPIINVGLYQHLP
jgi:hypothetical protein